MGMKTTVRWLLLALGLVIAVVTVAAVPTGCGEEPTAGALDDRLRALIEALPTPYPAGDDRYLSSNAYDYLDENPAFDEIVALGYEALPGLEEHLATTATAGLGDYLVCVAMETITRCDLKQFETFAWADSRTFAEQWDRYLREVPSVVADIIECDLCARVQGSEIAKLGAPAVPYVVEYAEVLDGQYGSEVPGVLSTVTVGSVPTTTVADFWEKNMEIIEKLRAYVEDR
jgi:hypothetical protein